MHLGDHFHAVAQRLAAAGFEEGDLSALVNNYARGVQSSLDACECPRCGDFLKQRRDRLLSTPREAWVTYSCQTCHLELSRADLRPWWRRVFG